MCPEIYILQESDQTLMSSTPPFELESGEDEEEEVRVEARPACAHIVANSGFI